MKTENDNAKKAAIANNVTSCHYRTPFIGIFPERLA